MSRLSEESYCLHVYYDWSMPHFKACGPKRQAVMWTVIVYVYVRLVCGKGEKGHVWLSGGGLRSPYPLPLNALFQFHHRLISCLNSPQTHSAPSHRLHASLSLSLQGQWRSMDLKYVWTITKTALVLKPVLMKSIPE